MAVRGARPSSPGTFQFVAHVHKYLQDQIVLADAKAGVISGIAGGLFVAYREVTSDWGIVAPSDIVSVSRGLLQVPFLFAVFMTVLHGFIVLAPRMPESYKRSRLEWFHRALERVVRTAAEPLDLGGGGNLVRWPDLADPRLYRDTAEYSSDVLRRSQRELDDSLAQHSVVLARIAAEKHQHVRLATNYVVVAGLIVALLSMLGRLGQ